MGPKDISEIRFSAPFEVLNVDVDKDPIQTAEDLFAHIFKIAEKAKPIYLFLNAYYVRLGEILILMTSRLWKRAAWSI